MLINAAAITVILAILIYEIAKVALVPEQIKFYDVIILIAVAIAWGLLL